MAWLKYSNPSEGIGRPEIGTLFAARGVVWRAAARRRGGVARAGRQRAIYSILFVSAVWTGPGSNERYAKGRGVREDARGRTDGLLTNHEREADRRWVEEGRPEGRRRRRCDAATLRRYGTVRYGRVPRAVCRGPVEMRKQGQ